MQESPYSSGETPTAHRLHKLRDRINEETGVGGVTKLAQELRIPRSDLARLVAPKTIERVAKLERALND